MITLGEIQSIDALSNLCVVRLPTLEGAGNKNKIQLSATMMLPPGVGAGYEVGDVVFVAFVDNTLSRPLVLGQLYRGPGKGTRIDNIGEESDLSLGCAKSMKCEELEAVNAATIPRGTILTGSRADQTTTIEDLITRISELEENVKVLQAAVIALGSAAAIGINCINPALALGCTAAVAGVAASSII